MQLTNLKTKNRSNLPLSFITPLEEDVNKGIEYEDGENYIRLDHVFYWPNSDDFYAVFYYNGEHHSIRHYDSVANDKVAA